MLSGHHLSVPLLMFTMSASIGSAGCGEYNGRPPVAPSRFGSATNQTFTLAVEPTELFRRPIVEATCRSRQAFLLPFNLRLRNELSSGLFLNEVRFQFDSAGIAPRGISMRQPDLLSHFGTVGIPPLGSREFPFSVPLGCATQRVDNLSIFVETVDAARVFNARTLTLAIR
jgi:hypothetical protein